MKTSILVSFFVILTAASIYYISIHIIKNEFKNLTKLAAWKTSQHLSEKIRNEIQNKMRFYNNIENRRQFSSASNAETFIKSSIIKNDQDIIYFSVYKNLEKNNHKPEFEFINNTGIIEINENKVKEIQAELTEYLKDAFEGKLIIKNVSNKFNKPVLIYIIPIKDEYQVQSVILSMTNASAVAASLLTEKIPEKTIVQKEIVSFAADFSGEIVVHPDLNLVLSPQSMKENKAVQLMIKDIKDSNLIEYSENENSYWGAFQRIPDLNLGVVTISPVAKYSEFISRVRIRSIIVLVIVLLISFLFSYLYTNRVSKKFNTVLQKVSTNESGINTNISSEKNLKGEIEEEEVVINKDDSKQHLEDKENIKEEIIEEAKKKKTTVFLSAIQNFSELSEKSEPEELVRLLNDFNKIINEIILENKGIVIKFIGRSALALWGKEKHSKKAMTNSVNAALSMREKLIEYNKRRESENKPAIKFGCGIKTGEIITGTLKTSDTTEFAIMGEAVKAAARIEKSTSAMNLDILICEETYEAVQNNIICEEAAIAKFKESGKEFKLYAVLGEKNNKNTVHNIQELKEKLYNRI
ncbi:MAG: hypothetical protein OEZ22_06900 [Spirochaetia bacterium]|nr:hypothetical protein [Spirochaetia bacterium]